MWLLVNLKLHTWFTFVAYVLFLLDSVGQNSMKNDTAFLGSSHKMNYFFVTQVVAHWEKMHLCTWFLMWV